MIIVAQRVGTIMNADRIVVMDDGRDRRHRHARELLADNETYREIVYSQLSRGGGRVSGPADPAAWRAARPAGRPAARRPGGSAGVRRPRWACGGAAGGEAEGLPRLVPAPARRRCGRRRRSSPVVIVLAVVSVAFAVIGPKILGNATNIIFDGRDRQAAAGRA